MAPTCTVPVHSALSDSFRRLKTRLLYACMVRWVQCEYTTNASPQQNVHMYHVIVATIIDIAAAYLCAHPAQAQTSRSSCNSSLIC